MDGTPVGTATMSCQSFGAAFISSCGACTCSCCWYASRDFAVCDERRPIDHGRDQRADVELAVPAWPVVAGGVPNELLQWRPALRAQVAPGQLETHDHRLGRESVQAERAAADQLDLPPCEWVGEGSVQRHALSQFGAQSSVASIIGRSPGYLRGRTSRTRSGTISSHTSAK